MTCIKFFLFFFIVYNHSSSIFFFILCMTSDTVSYVSGSDLWCQLMLI